MRRFAHLFSELDETTRTGEKVAALVRYFGEAPPEDAAWAVHFLSGSRPRRLIPVRQIGRSGRWRCRMCRNGSSMSAIMRWVISRKPSRSCSHLLPVRSDLPLNRWVERLLELDGQQ
jgi:DNA ligase 1